MLDDQDIFDHQEFLEQDQDDLSSSLQAHEEMVDASQDFVEEQNMDAHNTTGDDDDEPEFITAQSEGQKVPHDNTGSQANTVSQRIKAERTEDPQMLQSEEEPEEFEIDTQNLLEPQVDLIEEQPDSDSHEQGLSGSQTQPNVVKRFSDDNTNGNSRILQSRLSYSNNTNSNQENDIDDIDDYIPSVPGRDERRGCRSLICDDNGIIIAEMVYRCMICSLVTDSIAKAQAHYHKMHMKDTPGPPSQPHGKNTNVSRKEQQVELTNSMDDEEEFPSDEQLDFGLDHSDSIFNTTLCNPPKKGNFIYSPSPADYVPGRNASRALVAAAQGQSNNSVRGGYVTCAVCNITKYYASVQRRYGMFTCMGCAKFFGRFLIKPRRYFCPNLGSCPLDVSPRCKACLLLACINTYNIDEKRMKIVNANRPLKRAGLPVRPPQSQTSVSLPSGSVNNSHQNWSSNQLSANVSAVPKSSIMVKPAAVTISKVTQSSTATTASFSKGSLLATTRSSNGTITSSSTATRSGTTGPPSGSSLSVSLVNSGRKGTGCRQCANCLAEDCGRCNYCLDKPKFGGPNTLKKKCIQKKCLLVQPNQGVRLKISRR